MKIAKTICGFIVFFTMLACLANGEIIYIGIEANITDVDDPSNFFDNKISVGSQIKGYYSYDTSTPPGYLDATGATYDFSYPHGIYLEAGEFEFQTSPNLGSLGLNLGNNFSLAQYDFYSIHSFNNLKIFDSYYEIHWELRDNTGNAISNLELPTDAPVLDDWQSQYFVISGLDSFNIYAEVVQIKLIPEPATVLLFGLGGLLLKRKKIYKGGILPTTAGVIK